MLDNDRGSDGSWSDNQRGHVMRKEGILLQQQVDDKIQINIFLDA